MDENVGPLYDPQTFQGRVGQIQINALKGWKLLHPDIEIIIFGREEGTAEVTRELGVVSHIKNFVEARKGRSGV